MQTDVFLHSSVVSVAVPPLRPAILVPWDGSPESAAVLPVAQTLAGLEEAVLHLAHIAAQDVPLGELLQRLGLQADDVRGWVIDVTAGNPAREILRLAEKLRCRLLVMRRDGGPQVVGSVVREVSLHAPCPVLLVPAGTHTQPYRLRRIVVPHDGSPTTTEAVRAVLPLAVRTRGELIVLHVAACAAPPRESGALTTPLYVDQQHHEWPAWAHEFLDRACAFRESGARIRLAIAAGATGPEISQFAAEHHADLVALGWHGHWEARHAETVKSVLRESSCPVLLVRVPPGDAPPP